MKNFYQESFRKLQKRHGSFCELCTATLIIRFQHMSEHRKQSRRKGSSDFADPFISLRNHGGHTQNLLLAVIPLEGKQGERDLNSVTKAGRIPDQGCNTHGRKTSIFLPSASLKPILV